jgi:hypothetical protein
VYSVTKPKPDFIINPSLMNHATLLPNIRNQSFSKHSSGLPSIKTGTKRTKELNLRDDTKNIKEKLYASENDVNEVGNSPLG